MVDCPFILKKTAFKAKKGETGITLTELLIVVAVLAILMIVFLAAFKPWTQEAKARDARRKSDLQKLKSPLEDYYNDNDCYPVDLQTLADEGYISEVPQDPGTDEDYTYTSDPNCNWYRIYVSLEFANDSEIVEAGCGTGCGPGGDAGTGDDRCAYNYGVCGGGVSLEGCTSRCPGETEDICEEMSEGELRAYCGEEGSCCPGSQYVLTCPPVGRPYCCPKEE